MAEELVYESTQSKESKLIVYRIFKTEDSVMVRFYKDYGDTEFNHKAFTDYFEFNDLMQSVTLGMGGKKYEYNEMYMYHVGLMCINIFKDTLPKLDKYLPKYHFTISCVNPEQAWIDECKRNHGVYD